MAEWKAYSEIEPFGNRHQDIGMGIIASTIANFAMRTKKLTKPFTPDQFMVPTASDKKNKVNVVTVKDIFKSLRDSMKGKKKNG